MKEQIIELLKQGRKLEAVAMAHRLGGGTLQQAKRYVDAVERETMNGNSPDDSDRVVRSWSVKYNGGKPISITLRDQYGERQLVEGTLEWNAILAEITQTRNERDSTTEGKGKRWRFSWWSKRNQERMANANTSTPSKWKFYLPFGSRVVFWFYHLFDELYLWLRGVVAPSGYDSYHVSYYLCRLFVGHREKGKMVFASLGCSDMLC